MLPKVVGAVAVGLALAAPATAERVASEVDIDNYHVEGDEAVFSGVVSAPKRVCEKGRKVIVIGRDLKGGTRVFGNDKTSRRGRFEVREQIPFFEAFAYAKLKRARLDNGTKCKGARSKEISTAG